MLISTRVSIWRANNQLCLYCGDPIKYRDLEIDHLIPDSTSEIELARLIGVLGLPKEFSLNGAINLVPSHHDCNRKKRATQFNEATLRYYLGIWGEKQVKIIEEKSKFERSAERDDILAKLTRQVEAGAISREEVEGLLKSIRTPDERTALSPLVLSFSRLCNDLKVAEMAQSELIDKLRITFQRPLILAEPYTFTGESLSVRLAIWNFDIDRLDPVDLSDWELLDVEPAYKLYGDNSAEALGDAINDTYNIFYAEKYGCPKCGGKVVMSGSASESGEFAIGACQQCGWEDYDS
ncbi:HNH endonuclease [Thiohalobacter thiocyanaticus]|nr:HNH endonuclease signature motif containing protein [Thiohalobacter thiocyanaticus]